ncbi:hypothetical protein GO986_08505 [Deinococcus sp. HMF7620]|uniref:Uncharacterized protein n=1 Tax=Deinococcus arboris TaxID=2682977 RepID=A0A7C9M1L9_9DEIO|nr:hypothetical protein [Deinococcus arboris]MVN86802.1 hypothetical protein [Deinococcus arboris]
MDSLIYASVRQVAATWYAIALTQKKTSKDAAVIGMRQAEIYLSDLGLVGDAARSYLEGAQRSVDSNFEGRLDEVLKN